METTECPYCGKVSNDPTEVKEKYCRNCQMFYGEIKAHANVCNDASAETIQALGAIIHAAFEQWKSGKL